VRGHRRGRGPRRPPGRRARGGRRQRGARHRASDIEPPPSFGAHVRSDFIQGVGKVRGRFVLLLDVDQALSLDGLAG